MPGVIKLNKLQGFYELRKLGIPIVPWKKFDDNTRLDPARLWTIRVALETGNDINLPRAVGVRAAEARTKALALARQINNQGIVIYYPFFLAIKSGVLEINNYRTTIEAVEHDLWNLVNHGRRNVTILITPEDTTCKGQADFLAPEELAQLLQSAGTVKRRLRSLLAQGSSILLEWSFAVDTDLSLQPLGKPYLVFYECRSLP